MVNNYNSSSKIRIPISGAQDDVSDTQDNKVSFRLTEEELRKQIGDKKVDIIIDKGKFDVIDEEFGDDSEFDSEEDRGDI